MGPVQGQIYFKILLMIVLLRKDMQKKVLSGMIWVKREEYGSRMPEKRIMSDTER